MALNSNAQFYKKVLSNMILVFCVSFVVILNLIRFSDLLKSPSTFEKKNEAKLQSFYRIEFFDEQRTDFPKVVFADASAPKAYFRSSLSFLQNKENLKVFVVSCALETQIKDSFFKKYPNINFEKKHCPAQFEDFEKLMNVQDAIVFFLFDSEFLRKNHIIDFVAIKTLKPKVKMMEIKNAN